MTRQAKADKVKELLNERYPGRVEAPLDHTNAHELLFATILSAQCTDVRVNVVTKELFGRYKEIRDYAEADLEELKQIIRPTGFYNNKAKNIKAAAQKIMEQYGGHVPDTMEELLSLPGVAKKTASVVLWQWFDKNEGFTVDTHVKRLANWFGLTKSQNPDIISRDLEKLYSQDEWGNMSLKLILLGRELLTARNPQYQDTVWEDLILAKYRK